jgi:hypothetical protein
MVAGGYSGECLILRKLNDIWSPNKRFQHNDKQITAFLLLEGSSIAVASEDRKLNLVNLISGALEYQVILLTNLIPHFRKLLIEHM